MRLLLAANASYVPPRGGATRSNLVWLRHLAGAGHECRIVCAALPNDVGRREQLAQERIEAGSGTDRIAIWPVEDPAGRVQTLRRQIAEFAPDWVLISSEDLGHSLLREAQHSAPGRVVYLAHTPQFFPFGPASWNPDTHAATLVARSAGIVVIGHAMAGHVEEALGRPATVIHPPIYGNGPYPNHAEFAGSGYLTMINPCAVKGISIFAELARHRPQLPFAYIPGWGTTAGDRALLAGLANVRALPNCRDIDELLAQTRVLLMPSLWYEGFGLIVIEAMLRGIPVVASDSGGLVEAKQGTGYLIPVRGIERYESSFDEHAMPVPVLPANPVEPWLRALDELVTDRASYEAESVRSREAALGFASGLDAGCMERFLLTFPPAATAPLPGARHAIESLTPAQRSLALARLRKVVR
jgi:hypothetical protein